MNHLARIVLAAMRGRGWPLVLVVLAIAAVLPSLWAGLHGDDYVLFGILTDSTLREVYPSRLDIFNFFDGTAERTRRMLDLGLLPWWTFPGVRVAFWRPVSALTYWVDHALWPERPVLMHAHNLAWLGALVATAWLTYRRILPDAGTAGLAALLYALDRTHAFPAVDIVGRNTILGALFGILAVLLHDRWRRAGWRAGAIAAPGCLAVALLSAENAVASAGFLIAHAAFLERGGWRGRLRALLPHGLVVTAWQLLYGGLGYGVAEVAPRLVNPLREPLEFASGVARYGPVLLSAAWVGPPAETFLGLEPRAAVVRWCAAVLVLGVLSLLLAPLLKRDPVARFWALGQVLAIVPLCTSGPHDRYLLLVGFGAMGLLARYLWGLVSRESWAPDRGLAAWAAGLAACALLVVHVIVAPVQVVRIALGRAATPPASDSIPADGGIGRQTLVVVSAPDAVRMFHWFFVRTVERRPLPARTRVLASGGAPLRVERADAQSLRVRWEGPQEPIFRPPDHPLVAGQRIRLAGTEVEVAAVSDDGWPREAVFRFDGHLDDEGFRWVRWDASLDRFVPFRPPAVGESVVVR